MASASKGRRLDGGSSEEEGSSVFSDESEPMILLRIRKFTRSFALFEKFQEIGLFCKQNRGVGL